MAKDLFAFRAWALAGRVSDATLVDYVAKHDRVLREAGSTDYVGLLRFFRARCAGTTGRSPACLAAHLSAVRFVRQLRGEPLPKEQHEDLLEVLRGLRGRAPMPQRRGALTEDRLRRVTTALAARNEHDSAEGLIVLYSACLRPRDIGELRRSAVVEGGTGVWVRRKLNRVRQHEVGHLYFHVVHSEEAAEILRSKGDAEVLFPLWRPRVISRVVRECSIRFGWEPNLAWDGAHTERHGAAADRFAQALEHSHAVWVGVR